MYRFLLFLFTLFSLSSFMFALFSNEEDYLRIRINENIKNVYVHLENLEYRSASTEKIQNTLSDIEKNLNNKDYLSGLKKVQILKELFQTENSQHIKASIPQQKIEKINSLLEKLSF